MTKSSKDKYSDPELRDKIKEEIQAGDKGGEPGQWSARKAQMMAKRYKEEGGGYNDNKKDETAKHLDQWTKEEWQTKDGDANARSEEGTHRYLPKKAWEKLSENEKEATDEQKLEGSKAGDQYVDNTPKAKKARKEVSEEPEEEKSANLASNKKRKTEDESDKTEQKETDDNKAVVEGEEEEAQMTDEDEAGDSDESGEDDDVEPGVAEEDAEEDAGEEGASLEDDDDDAEFVPDDEK